MVIAVNYGTQDHGRSFKMRRRVVRLIHETHPFGANAIFCS